MRTSRSAAMLAAAIALIAAYVLPAAAEPVPGHATEEWLAKMEAYYNEHPQLQSTPGSGWKPYNRTKWYRDMRKDGDRLATAGDVWSAWEEKQRILRENGNVRAGGTWFSLGPANYSGRILDIEFDPTNTDIIYVGSASGGLWKSTDHGLSYTPITDEIPSIAIGAVCVLPWDTSIVLIGTGEGANGDVDGVGILKSTDGGATWNTTDLVRAVVQGHGFHVMEANPTTHTILAGASDGLWRSTDDGETWIDVRTGGDYYDVVWKTNDVNTVFTVKGSDSTGNNIKISTDDGLTWTRAGTGQPASAFVGKTKLAVSPAQPEWIYANISNQAGDITNAGICRSTDGGATWTVRYGGPSNIPGGQGWYNLSIAVDPDDANVVIAGGVRLYRSTDGAASFSIPLGEANVHVDHHAIAYEPGASNTVWVGSDGGVWRNDSDGNFWSNGGNRSAGLVTYQFYDICISNYDAGPYYALGGTQDQGTDKWTGSTNWLESLGADGMVCMISPENGTTVYAEIQNGGTRRNLNSGNAGSWATISFPGTKQWVNPWACGQVDGDILMGASSLGVYKSTNTGTSWTNVASHVPVWFDFYDLDDDIVWTAVGGTTCYYTTDGGGSWTQTSPYGFSTGSPVKILAHPSDPATAWVTFSGYGAVAHVAMTTDWGVTWADVSGDLPLQPTLAIAVDPENTSDWYVGTDNSIWMSQNGGVNWLPCDNALPNVEVHDLEISNAQRKLVAGTYGRGMWEMDLPSVVPGAGEPEVAIARNLMLDAPQPNPAPGRTILRWAAHSNSAVRLEIYDVQGRRVESLDTLARGDGIIRTTMWHAENRPAGVYFAVVSSGEERVSRKVILAK